jgi:Holliday junction DNA helicase RuvB
LDYYGSETLFTIIQRSARLLQVTIDRDGAREIARRSRGTPRIANRLLRRCRDFAQADPALAAYDGVISREVADHALRALEVDQLGLDEMDKRILLCIMEKYDGGPVGISTLAVAVGEEPGTIGMYEPYSSRRVL